MEIKLDNGVGCKMNEKLTKKQKERIEAFLQERLVSIRVTDKNGTRIVSTVLNKERNQYGIFDV